jgi:hypothetical protein
MLVRYFGCWEQAGHFLCDEHGRHMHDEKVCPWKDYEIDSKLQPGCYEDRGYWQHRGPETEGEALVHHKDGWTALSFWDRSVDKRGKCNSTFMAEGIHDFETMKKIAMERFPKIWSRFTFEVKLVQPN